MNNAGKSRIINIKRVIVINTPRCSQIKFIILIKVNFNLWFIRSLSKILLRALK